MPVYSMTGYASVQHTPGGNAEIATPAACLALELRSVNSRFLDVVLRLPDELRPHAGDVDAVVLTHGGDTDGDGSSFYAVIPALLDALGGNGAHISFMTAMNTSHSAGPSRYGFVEWKRRAERLVRASGHPYTIVRPGWFDYQGPDDRRIDLRQGDLVTGRPGVDRRHIAQVLLEGALNPSGTRRTVEVFSAAGAPVTDYEALFAATRADEPGVLDGVLDTNNVPLAEEPARVRDDIARLGRRGARHHIR